MLGACSRPAPQAAGPNQTFQGLRLSRTSGGRLRWSVNARQGALREAQGLMELANPEIELYQDGRPSTSIRSKHGVFHQASQNMRLEGDVVVVSRREGRTLRTDKLDYKSARRTFQTDGPVLIEGQGLRLRGKGLTASQDLSEIRIRHQESSFQ